MRSLFLCEAGIGNNCQTNYAMGYQYAGGFAEYCLLNKMVVDYGPVHKIPDNISYDEAALAEPLACVLNALELTNIRLGDTVVIIGAGPIGCMIIPIAYMQGALKVIVVQRSRPRMEAAKIFGADSLYLLIGGKCNRKSPGGNRRAGSRRHNNRQFSTIACDALQMAKNRAKINLFGGLPAGSAVNLDTNIIHYKELMVTGAHGSVPRHHKQAIDLIAHGKIDMKQFISHNFPLDEIRNALQQQKAMRV